MRRGEGKQLLGIALTLIGPVVVTGLSVAPANASYAVVAEVATASAPAIDVGRSPDLGGSTAPFETLRGVAFLDRLTELSRTDAISIIGGNPAAIAELSTRPPAAATVADWWSAAPVRTRSALLSAAPQVVGNLEGVPLKVRDVANRGVLERTADEIEARLDGHAGRAERAALVAQQHMLEQVELALASDDGAVRRLVALDTEGEGRAVIAVGDVATADFVSYLVPGMFFGVDAQIVAWTETAADVVRAQQEWLDELRPGDPATVAAVAWIGYQTPSLLNVASMELARDGRDALTASLRGLRAERGDDQPYISILAHSYGSTAALLSLEEDDVWVDALVLVGSPGSTARSVDALHVADANVWVGAAEWDPIPASGVFGSQPLSPSYGAKRFSVAPGVDPLTGEVLDGAMSHNDYFAPGGSSLRNLALISIGEGEYATAADRSAGDASARLTKRLHRLSI